jgi:hypothetical protein
VIRRALLTAVLLLPALAAAADPASPVRDAIAIGNAFLPTLKLKPSDYKLVKVENGTDSTRSRGPSFWRLTYKSCGARAVDAEPVCKGGEVFVGVDLKTRKAEFLGAGE